MNLLINSIVLFLFVSISVYGQTEITEANCKAYDSLLNIAIEQGNHNLVPNITIKSTLIKRAIGPVEHEITIYFDEYEVQFEEEEFPPKKEATIRKVVFNINAGSYAIRYQYYFTKKGTLCLYNEIEVGYKCIDRKLFFDGQKLVKHKLKPTKKGCFPEDKVKGFDRTNLTEDDIKFGAQIQKEAQKFVQLLRLNYALISD